MLLTWEYPPRIVGEIAHHTKKLATGLSEHNNVTVVTFHDALQAQERVSQTFQIYRIPNPIGPHMNIVTWALGLAIEVERVVSDIYYNSSSKIDLIDAHEWQFVTAAVALKKALHIPFVLTLHSLEDHRSSEHTSPLVSCIRGLERLGASESSKIITGSEWLKSEVTRIHSVPASRIVTVARDSPSIIDKTLTVYSQALTNQIRE